MSELRWPELMDRPGPSHLPSGRAVFVGARDETWVTVELGEELCATVDDLDPGQVDSMLIGLHRPRSEPQRSPGERPYGCEAAVRYDAGFGRLSIVPLPTGAHEDYCQDCDRSAAAFSAWFPSTLVVGVLDVLAGLPVDDAPWDVRRTPPLVWRGRRDERGRALIEELPSDDRPWPETDLPVAAAVPLGAPHGP